MKGAEVDGGHPKSGTVASESGLHPVLAFS